HPPRARRRIRPPARKARALSGATEDLAMNPFDRGAQSRMRTMEPDAQRGFADAEPRRRLRRVEASHVAHLDDAAVPDRKPAEGLEDPAAHLEALRAGLGRRGIVLRLGRSVRGVVAERRRDLEIEATRGLSALLARRVADDREQPGRERRSPL